AHGVPADYGEHLILHRSEYVPLEDAESGKLVYEKDAFVRLMDRAWYDSRVREGPDDVMATIGVMPYISEQLGFAPSTGLDECGARERGDHLPLGFLRQLLRHLLHLLELFLAENYDLALGIAFVYQDLFPAFGAPAGRRYSDMVPFWGRHVHLGRPVPFEKPAALHLVG